MNFQELNAKLKALDEGKSLEECGGVMIGEPAMSPKQQDNVSMNVTMSGQGPQGVRDLMDVIRAIEQGVDGGKHADVLIGDPGEEEILGSDHQDMEGVEPPVHYGGQGPEGAKFDLYMQQRKDQLAKQKPVGEVQGDEQERFGNAAPGGSPTHVHGVDAVTQKGDDMNSKGGESPLARAPGTNPLVNRLQSMYEAIKESGEKKTMSRAAKGVMKYGKDGKDLDKVRDKYNKYDESLAEWGVNLTQPHSDLWGLNGPAEYNDKANTNAMMAKYDEMIKRTEQEIEELKTDPSRAQELKMAQEQLDGLRREQMHNITGTGVDDATNALRKQAIAKNELTPGQWLQKATQYFKGKITGKPQPGVSYDRYDTSKQGTKDWTTSTPYTPESINESSDILKLAKMLRG